MKVPCPSCEKTLSIGDNLAGKRVKCPGCAEVFQVPAASAVAAAPTKKAAAPIAAVKKGAPPAPVKKRCPECEGALTSDGLECTECGWTARPAKPKRRPKTDDVERDDDLGRCYVHIRKDEVGLNEEIEKRLKKYFETEELDMELMPENEDPPEELGPNDVVIAGRVNVADYGSQFMRYFMTMVTVFGPGACKLEAEADIETEDGTTPVKAKVMQGIGVLGGTGAGLMKRNVQVVAGKIAGAAARHLTGRKLLNAQVYLAAYWTLGLGLISLIPYIGIPFGLVGIMVGIFAMLMISNRKLPRGKAPTFIGLGLCFVGFAISAIVAVIQLNMR